MHFDVAGYKGFGGYFFGDDLTVIASSITKSEDGFLWTFTPVEAFLNGTHPLAGHRQFGLTINNNSNGSVNYTFFTRGVDRSWGYIEHQINSKFFSGAHKLWMMAMKNVADYVNKTGGRAAVGQYLSKRNLVK